MPWWQNKYQRLDRGYFFNLLALREEGSEHDGARSHEVLATEVGFGHGGLDGDRVAV